MTAADACMPARNNKYVMSKFVVVASSRFADWADLEDK
jgi:hypothetical protein